MCMPIPGEATRFKPGESGNPGASDETPLAGYVPVAS
jgi:hypothetical protein